MAKKKVLIIEDERIIARDLQDKIEGLGYDVPYVIYSGEDAINRVIHIKPDLILMDIKLEGTFDGVDTAREIKKIFDVPIIYLTAYADSDTLKRVKDTDPAGYILKPFKERELDTTIKIALFKYKAEQKLKERAAWLESILDSLPEMIIVTDSSGKIQLINPAAAGFLSILTDEWLGKPLTAMLTFSTPDKPTLINDVLEHSQNSINEYYKKTELVLLSETNKTFSVKLSIYSLKKEAGKIASIVWLIKTQR
jgi:PAS domain S-box-containing protein